MGEAAATNARSFPQNEPDQRIALRFDNTTNQIPTAEELKKIRSIGIDLLEVSFPSGIPAAELDSFYLLLNASLRFSLEYQIKMQTDLLLNTIQTKYSSVPDHLRDNIAAVKIFDFPADYNSSFRAATDSLITNLTGQIGEPFYYQSAYINPESALNQMDFFVSRVVAQADTVPKILSSAVYFEPANDTATSLQALQVVLNRSLDRRESLVIIPANWFFDRLASQASFAAIISSYLDGESITFPMPDSSHRYPSPNWPIIILLFIWAGFILHYKHQPVYKAALPRYFFNHTFFIHDVMHLRIRNASPGIIILLQYSLLTGFFFYLLANNFISEIGLNSLSSHFPALIYPGFEKLSLFIIGTLFTIVVLLISILWLYVPNKKLKQINQAINLYSWPLQINLIVVTIMVYSLQIYSPKNWAFVAVLIYTFVWLSSFIIAAIDGARFLEKFRTSYLFLTIGLYLLFFIAIIGTSLWFPAIYQPLELAFLLP